MRNHQLQVVKRINIKIIVVTHVPWEDGLLFGGLKVNYLSLESFQQRETQD
jgi:hypothetical protein